MILAQSKSKQWNKTLFNKAATSLILPAFIYAITNFLVSFYHLCVDWAPLVHLPSRARIWNPGYSKNITLLFDWISRYLYMTHLWKWVILWRPVYMNMACLINFHTFKGGPQYIMVVDLDDLSNLVFELAQIIENLEFAPDFGFASLIRNWSLPYFLLYTLFSCLVLCYLILGKHWPDINDNQICIMLLAFEINDNTLFNI